MHFADMLYYEDCYQHDDLSSIRLHKRRTKFQMKLSYVTWGPKGEKELKNHLGK